MKDTILFLILLGTIITVTFSVVIPKLKGRSREVEIEIKQIHPYWFRDNNK